MNEQAGGNALKKFNSRTFTEYLFITLGAAIMSLGVAVFLIDAKVVPGGVTGLSMTVHYLFGGKVSVGILMWVMNLPLFIWGVKE
ncbi:MAG: YitT family protein, partial [Bacteroidales bacterium]|nr:YitT family protein [Candidatus Latescibacterota bacterium]